MPVAPVSDQIELYYETFGVSVDPAMFLIMGLGMQMTHWDQRLCKMLSDQGFYVIRFDNRDVGLSTKVASEQVPYSLHDMTRDTIGLFDYLGISKAHVVGASLGGMVAQLLAIEYPSRVLSLASLMSSPNSPSLGSSEEERIFALFTEPARSDEERIDQIIKLWRALQSPIYQLSEHQLQALAGKSLARSHYPEGVRHQLDAVLAAEDRTEALSKLHLPVVVIHGDVDPLVDVARGRATAEAIPDAKFQLINGMGHDIPFPKWPEIIEAIVSNAKSSTRDEKRDLK